ncbi:MAG: hypothetical protein WD078_16545 [Woeseia sp.]
MWYQTLILTGLFMSLSVNANGLNCPASNTNSGFYALSPSADWIVQLSWHGNKQLLSEKVRRLSDESLNFRTSIGSQPGFDSGGRIVMSGEIVYDYNARRVIARLDPGSDEFVILGDGYGQVSLANTNQILFFRYNEGLKSQWIYVADLGEEELIDARRLFALNGPTRIVRINDEMAAFYDAVTRKAYVYSAQEKEVSELSSMRPCIPVALRTIVDEWICQSPNVSGQFFLVDQQGAHTETFNLGTPVVAVAYQYDRDSLLFSRVETSRHLREEINFYEYVFAKRVERLVGKDLRVSPHSVFRSERPTVR